MAKAPEFHIAKLAPPESNALAYPHHDRSNDLYSMWMSGFCQEEIASFAGISVEDVDKDLMYVSTRLPVRTIIQHNNDRSRILLQRNQSESFRNMMRDSLAQPVSSLLAAGISPAGILKEFREATGMVQKAEPLLQINTQNISNSGSAGTGGVTSTEDIIRRVLGEINQDALAQTTSTDPESDQVIDVETPDEDHIPDDNE